MNLPLRYVSRDEYALGMRRNFALLITSVLAIAFLQAPAANAAIADCVSLGYPSVSSSSYSISFSTSISVSCTSKQLGTGGGPLYSIVEESFGANCSGPYSLSAGMFGTIQCSFPIGGTTGSLRTGATTSTLKIWFAYDFSTKFLTVNHSAIPARSTGTSGGTSGPPAGADH